MCIFRDLLVVLSFMLWVVYSHTGIVNSNVSVLTSFIHSSSSSSCLLPVAAPAGVDPQPTGGRLHPGRVSNNSFWKMYSRFLFEWCDVIISRCVQETLLISISTELHRAPADPSCQGVYVTRQEPLQQAATGVQSLIHGCREMPHEYIMYFLKRVLFSTLKKMNVIRYEWICCHF